MNVMCDNCLISKNLEILDQNFPGIFQGEKSTKIILFFLLKWKKISNT
jgi:hypothetical protein